MSSLAPYRIGIRAVGWVEGDVNSLAGGAHRCEPSPQGAGIMSRRSGGKGGAGGRPPLDKPLHDASNGNDNANEPQRWRVVIVTERCAVWNRYPTEHQAIGEAEKLKRHGMNARAEADL